MRGRTGPKGIDLATGRPIENPGIRYDNGPALVIPSGIGAHAWMPMSYSPKTGLVYIPAMEHPLVYGDSNLFEIHEGRWNTGASFLAPPPLPGLPATPEGRRAALTAMTRGKLVAWDPVAQKAQLGSASRLAMEWRHAGNGGQSRLRRDGSWRIRGLFGRQGSEAVVVRDRRAAHWPGRPPIASMASNMWSCWQAMAARWAWRPTPLSCARRCPTA